MADLVDQRDERGMGIAHIARRQEEFIDIDGTICEDIPNEEPERMATAECFEGALSKSINV